MNALEIKNLHKSFKSSFLIKQYHILKGIELSVQEGEIYGFLGPNGAGKTTTMKCILNIIYPDQGDILLFGKSSRQASSRSRVGFLPEHPYFYDYLTPEELLSFTAGLFSMSSAEIRKQSAELLELVGLTAKKDIKLKKFSKGMVQRVGLAQALIHNTDFVILDEPFSGLDPIGRKELRDIIISLRESGKTVFFSSHILQDMEMMVDRVGIILDGKIRKEGKLTELVSQGVKYYEIVFSGLDAQLAGAAEWTSQDGHYIIRHTDSNATNHSIRLISEHKGVIHSVTPIRRTLEEVFLEELNHA